MVQAITRIGDRAVRLTAIPPRPIPQRHFRDEIMAGCHKLYYVPSEETLWRSEVAQGRSDLQRGEYQGLRLQYTPSWA